MEVDLYDCPCDDQVRMFQPKSCHPTKRKQQMSSCWRCQLLCIPVSLSVLQTFDTDPLNMQPSVVPDPDDFECHLEELNDYEIALGSFLVVGVAIAFLPQVVNRTPPPFLRPLNVFWAIISESLLDSFNDWRSSFPLNEANTVPKVERLFSFLKKQNK